MSEERIQAVRTTYKVYVETGVVFSADGQMQPKWLVMNGRRYTIDKIRDCRRAASMKAGGCGMRYTVEICGHQAYLYYEDTKQPSWFVESKEPVMVPADM